MKRLLRYEPKWNRWHVGNGVDLTTKASNLVTGGSTLKLDFGPTTLERLQVSIGARSPMSDMNISSALSTKFFPDNGMRSVKASVSATPVKFLHQELSRAQNRNSGNPHVFIIPHHVRYTLHTRIKWHKLTNCLAVIHECPFLARLNTSNVHPCVQGGCQILS